MKLLKYILILSAALSAAACGKDDGIVPDGEDDQTGGAWHEFTFAAGIDQRMAGEEEPGEKDGTRAGSDDLPTRCLMQIFDGDAPVGDLMSGTSQNGSYTFRVALQKDKQYTFCFWADRSSAQVASLTSVPYTQNTLAFAAKTTATPESIVRSGVTLQHAVAKVTLQSTVAVTFEGEGLCVGGSSWTTYNVLSGTAAGGRSGQFSVTRTGSFAANKEICSFYLLPYDSQDIVIDCSPLTMTCSGVKCAGNTCVVLQGDLSDNNSSWTVMESQKGAYYKALFDQVFRNSEGNFFGKQTSYGCWTYSASYETTQQIVEKILGASMLAMGWLYQTPWGESLMIYNYGNYIQLNFDDYTLQIQIGSNDGHPEVTLPANIH